MGHVINDALDDEGGEGTGEDASAIQRLVLIASAWSFITPFLLHNTRQALSCHSTVPGGKEGLTLRKGCK